MIMITIWFTWSIFIQMCKNTKGIKLWSGAIWNNKKRWEKGYRD